MTAKTQLKASTLTELRKAREVVAVGPSGLAYKLRPMSLERYALAGSLPNAIRQLAMEGADGINKVLTGDPEILTERGPEIITFLDGLVRQVVIEPSLDGVDIDELPVADTRWLVMVALGEADRDGEGKKLWGKEDLSIFQIWQTTHECGPDCPGCKKVLNGAF